MVASRHRQGATIRIDLRHVMNLWIATGDAVSATASFPPTFACSGVRIASVSTEAELQWPKSCA